MQPTNREISLAFWQDGANNCASIALIKAAMETYGLHNIFELSQQDGTYTATLRNGNIVTFTEQNLQDSIRVGSFQPSRDRAPDRQPMYEKIREYAQISFAVMVAQYNDKNRLQSFDTALNQLANGANARYVSQYLGLEHHASPVFRGKAEETCMIAWRHSPLLKHVVHMSQNAYDHYGEIYTNTSRFPKRIKLYEEAQHQFLDGTQQFNELHFINISRFGTFKETGKVHSIPHHVDRIVEHVRDKGTRNLVLHFHGGLISENMGMDSAERFYESFANLPDAHPVSIVWETGFLEALPQTFENVLRSDTLLRTLIMRAAKILGRKMDVNTELLDNGFYPSSLENYASLIQSNTAELTEEETASAFAPYEEIADDEPVLHEAIHLELEQISSEEEKEQMLTDEELDRIHLGEESLLISPRLLWVAARIAARCIKRFLHKRGHGVWPTIVEEACREVYLDDFGTEIWHVMKTQARDMWKSNAGRSGLEQYAGRYLTDKLNETFGGQGLNIHVVAHSAGSVAVCEWVKALREDSRYASFKFKSITLLAPACRCDLFRDTLMRYPDAYERLRVFTMHDRYERTDNLIPAPVLGMLYTRSLLYLISGILEGRRASDADALILGLHRHINLGHPYSRIPLLNEIAGFLNNLETPAIRLVLSKTDHLAMDGFRCTAVQHGGFSRDPQVIASVRHMISEEMGPDPGWKLMNDGATR